MATETKTDTECAFEFASFRLFPSRQLLTDGSRVCAVGSRAIEILVCLLERAGQMVTKQELLQQVWPDSYVDEANLRVHVSALRKALGDGQDGRRFIVNLTGQGYSFVAPVRRVDNRTPQAAAPRENQTLHNLAARTGIVLGRERDIEAIALQLPMRRCVTIAGPGGIGKTTVATAVAQHSLPVYDDGVWFVDLSAVLESQLVLASVAQVLGISLHAVNPLDSLIAHLQERRLLLVLDNCEHVIEEAANLVESVLLGTRQVSILATSRETLRVGGEWVHWLAPLTTPSEGTALTAAEALSFTAVRLFVECAAANLEGFTLQDADVPSVLAICRGLDGLPLAIELAAARIDLLGLEGLAKVLEEPFLLLSEGRRSALPRQQSLLRMLEWSYQLLTPLERSILRRLSVFRGDFSLPGAVEIAGGDGIGPEQVYAAVLTLSAKSLIASDVRAGIPNPRYRMLHVTRTLLRHKLEETAESATIRRRHAGYLLALLARAENDWEQMSRATWLDTYAHSIVDARAAIDWAFSPEGDASLGVMLTAMTLPLGFQLSQIEEFRGRVERALMHSQRTHPPQLLAQMRLNTALGMLAHNTNGPSRGRTAAAERAIEAGNRLNQPAHQVEPLLSLATAYLGAGEYPLCIEVAQRALDIGRAAGIPMAVLGAERVLAQALHFNGEHILAAQIAQRVIEHPAAKLPLAYNLTPVDRRVSLRIILARIAWVRGRFDEAQRLLEETLVIAAGDGAFSLCPALAFCAIPLSIWNTDDSEARRFNSLLEQEARRYTLGYWQHWARAFDAMLRLRAGEQIELPEFSDTLQLETVPTVLPALLTPEILSRAVRGASGWCAPEILRVQGEWLLGQGAAGAEAQAEASFREAADLAQRQGAATWELRAVMSLARLSKTQSAREQLVRVLDKFRSQPRTADLTNAAQLLTSLPLNARQLRTQTARRNQVSGG